MSSKELVGIDRSVGETLIRILLKIQDGYRFDLLGFNFCRIDFFCHFNIRIDHQTLIDKAEMNLLSEQTKRLGFYLWIQPRVRGIWRDLAAEIITRSPHFICLHLEHLNSRIDAHTTVAKLPIPVKIKTQFPLVSSVLHRVQMCNWKFRTLITCFIRSIPFRQWNPQGKDFVHFVFIHPKQQNEREKWLWSITNIHQRVQLFITIHYIARHVWFSSIFFVCFLYW